MDKQFDLVIYDMDGLIIDTEPYWRMAIVKVFGTVGLQLTDEDGRVTSGYRFDEVVDHWYNHRPWQNKTKQQVHDEVLDEMEHAIMHHGVAMQGLVSSLEYFKNKGVRIALASSSAMRLIKATVKKLEIEPYFELLVSAEHETHGKPHPAVFIRTADTLGVPVQRCLVLEDSFYGLLAAKAAKMKCVIVPDPYHYDELRLSIADWKIKSLEEIKEVV